QLKSDGVWALYVDGHGPVRETVQTKKSDDDAPTQEESTSSECPTEQIDLNSTIPCDPVSGLNEQTGSHRVRDRLIKLFEFLKAYVDLRFPPVRDIAEQPHLLWLNDLPDHSSIELFRDMSKPADDDENNDVVLRLTRPAITHCPAPPDELAEWLNAGWQDLSSKVEVRRSRNIVGKDGQTIIEDFEANYRRPLFLREWQEHRDQWLVNERPAR